ncbi:MAG TPA: membrane protein insertase YidC [Acidimicrobiales bacterium]|nr:membrane protein insertase YidC [Acidimicrobiales bacterium]
MLLASDPISAIAQPFFKAFAVALALFYSWVPNYAVAIALLTVIVMVIVFPITRRGTRSMMRMQIYQPELKKLTQRYKAPPGATAEEKAQLRREQQEEMMAFYKENNISPTGGCLPMFLQLPIFWILYGTIRGLVHTTTKVVHGVKLYVAAPLYISHTSRLYEAIMAANSRPVTNSGNIKLQSLGIDLADSVRSSGLSWAARTPYILMILAAVALQYVQMKQLSGRNPAAAAANPQMQSMQKVFPIVFAVIYTAIPAGVNVYFIVSSVFRIGQQEFMYRRDPQLQESLRQLRERHAATQKGPSVATPRQPGLLGWLGLTPPQTNALAAGSGASGSNAKGAATSSQRGSRPSNGPSRSKSGSQVGRPSSGASPGRTNQPSRANQQRPPGSGGGGQRRAGAERAGGGGGGGPRNGTAGSGQNARGASSGEVRSTPGRTRPSKPYGGKPPRDEQPGATNGTSAPEASGEQERAARPPHVQGKRPRRPD